MRITNCHTATLHLGFVSLRPGDTVEVPDVSHPECSPPSLRERVRTCSLMSAGLIREGEPTPLQKLGLPPPPATAPDLVNLAPDDAIAAVGACHDLSQLHTWAVSETRIDVMAALKKQSGAVQKASKR